MQRRHLAAVAALLGGVGRVAAQPARKVHRIGILSSLATAADMAGPQPRSPPVNVLLRGLRPDNKFSSLLDYDLEYHDGKAWKTLAVQRTKLPPSDVAESQDATALTWMGDDNAWIHRFAPVTSDRLRLTVRRTTFGFSADAIAAGETRRLWGDNNPARVSLREIEVYAPSK